MKLHLITYILVFAFATAFTQGQTLDDAKRMYLEGNYAAALPIFRAEYAVAPDNATLNQWLGASLFETGRWTEAEKYLAFAAQKNIPEAYIYLGELYTMMYRFADAEREFAKYQRAKRRDKAALAKLEEKRAYAGRLKRAIARTEDIQLIDSLVVAKSDFLSAYNLSAETGSVVPVAAFFKNTTETDKTLFMNERKDKIYYSQDGSLFTMEKLLDTFGNEKKLPENVNADGSQAFPFVMPDGLTVYFASTAHNSLGGYDIFATRYNLGTDSYLTPNQLNAPFNSPFNDYLLVTDDEKGIGWFASDRFQPADSVCVYTFIPNAQVTLLESDNDAYLARRAIISSISDSWKEDTDYASIRSRASKQEVVQQSNAGDFEFVINDRATYRSLTDFRSAQARNLFAQAIDLEKQLQSAEQQLAAQRDRFAAGDQSLRTAILDAERQTETMHREIERLKVLARNEEIRSF